MNRSSNALRALFEPAAGVEPVSRSTLTRGANSAHSFRRVLGADARRNRSRGTRSARRRRTTRNECRRAAATPHLPHGALRSDVRGSRCVRSERSGTRCGSPGMFGTRGSRGRRGSRGSGGRRGPGWRAGRRGPVVCPG